jgi:predicted negative regulator of RcsB-dependent stress response
MADQPVFDPKKIELQQLGPVMGLLEQFNLPPKVISFIRRNQRAILLTISAIVILIIASSAYTTYRDYRADRAASALDAALIAKQDNRQMLEKVVQEYGSTSSGLWARIELALLEEKEGQRSQAISRLVAINADLSIGSPLKPLVLTKLSGLYEQEQQFDKAVPLATELAALEGFASEAYKTLGRLYEQMGNKEEAAAMYGKFLELTSMQPGQGQVDPNRSMVQSRLNQLKK